MKEPLDLTKTSQRDLDYLSYRPSPPPRREIDTKPIETYLQTELEAGGEYSTCFQDFLTFAPHQTCSYVSDKIDVIEEQLTAVKHAIKQENLSSVIDLAQLEKTLYEGDNSIPYYKVLEDEYYANRDDIEGSFALDLFYLYSKILNEVGRIQEALHYIFYGVKDEIPDELIIKELEMIALMQQYDEAGEYEKINYFSLSNDTLIARSACRIVTILTNLAIDLCCDLELGFRLPTVYENVDLTGLEDMFKDTLRLTISDDRKWDRYLRSDMTTRLLYQARAARDKTLLANINDYEMVEGVQSDQMVADLMLIQKQAGLEAAMELARYANSMQLYMIDVRRSLKQKQVYRQIYQQKVSH